MVVPRFEKKADMMLQLSNKVRFGVQRPILGLFQAHNGGRSAISEYQHRNIHWL